MVQIWHQLGDDGATAIAKALEVNAALTQLRLDDNQIGRLGASAITEALKANTLLTELSVHTDNFIEGEAAKQLIEAAMESKSLEVLSGVPMKGLRDGRRTRMEGEVDQTFEMSTEQQ